MPTASCSAMPASTYWPGRAFSNSPRVTELLESEQIA